MDAQCMQSHIVPTIGAILAITFVIRHSGSLSFGQRQGALRRAEALAWPGQTSAVADYS
jgi:hypothetical protein